MKIVISGGWSYGNIGDEVIAASTIFLVNKYFVNCEKIYCAYDIDDFFVNHGIKAFQSIHSYLEKKVMGDWDNAVKLIQQDALNEYEKMFDKNTIFIMSGGGYFNELWKEQFISRILEIELAKKNGAKVAIIGQSIGPIFSAQAKEQLKNVLNKVDYLSVRDKSSIEILKDLGVSVKIHQSADLAIIVSDFLKTSIRHNETRIVNIMPASFTSYVGMTSKGKNKLCEKIKKRISKESLRYKREWIKIVRLLVENGGYKVRIVLSTRWKWDRAFSEEIRKKVKSDKVGIYECRTFRELCSYLMEGQLMISTKMHPLIISTSYGIPSIGISYNYKVDDFMQMIGNKEACVKNSELNSKVVFGIIAEKNKDNVFNCDLLKESVYKMFRELTNLWG